MRKTLGRSFCCLRSSITDRDITYELIIFFTFLGWPIKSSEYFWNQLVSNAPIIGWNFSLNLFADAPLLEDKSSILFYPTSEVEPRWELLGCTSLGVSCFCLGAEDWSETLELGILEVLLSNGSTLLWLSLEWSSSTTVFSCLLCLNWRY